MKLIKKINSLSRGKQTIIFIIIAAVLFLLRVGTSRDKYFSPEDVMYACERGLHYGPSEKVLKIEIQGKNALVIGKCEGGLSSVRAAKGLFFDFCHGCRVLQCPAGSSRNPPVLPSPEAHGIVCPPFFPCWPSKKF